MMLISRVLFLAATIAFSSSAFAAELSVSELKAKQQKLKTFDSMSLDFVQSKKKSNGRIIKRQGKAIFAKPDRFVWKLETPMKEYKVFDGQNFYDYSPDTKSAVKYRPTGTHSYELRQMVDLVLNFDALLRRYDLISASQEGDLIKVSLKPKTEGDLKAIELDMSESKSYITHLKMILGDKTELSHDFTNPVFSSVKVSEFNIPAGVKITDSN